MSNLRDQMIRLAASFPHGSEEQRSLVAILQEEGVSPEEISELHSLLLKTEHVIEGLMVNYNQEQRADHDRWYEANRSYEFAQARPDSGAAKRQVQKAVKTLNEILHRRPKRRRS